MCSWSQCRVFFRFFYEGGHLTTLCIITAFVPVMNFWVTNKTKHSVHTDTFYDVDSTQGTKVTLLTQNSSVFGLLSVNWCSPLVNGIYRTPSMIISLIGPETPRDLVRLTSITGVLPFPTNSTALSRTRYIHHLALPSDLHHQFRVVFKSIIS